MYLQLKTVIHEIFNDLTGADELLEDFVIRDEYKDVEDSKNYIWLLNGPEPSVNPPNHGNRYSLMISTLTVVVYISHSASEDNMLAMEEIINQRAWELRRVLKNIPYLVSTSAPSGYATYTQITDVEPGTLVLPDGSPRHSARFKLIAHHMKSEAA